MCAPVANAACDCTTAFVDIIENLVFATRLLVLLDFPQVVEAFGGQ
jgi:hypothetical protein